MALKTGISWAHHTFNIAWGCTEVSPGCDHCYAKTLAARYGFEVWGADAGRRRFSDKHWHEPVTWNRAAKKAGERRRVFCSSMADVFDAHPAVSVELPRLWALIKACPDLDWLLLTKRHARIQRSLPDDWGNGYPNVWLGVSVENQEWADRRIPVLLNVPAAVRWISAEPLLGPLTIEDYLMRIEDTSGQILRERIDWGVIGGESGPKARPMDTRWALWLQAQFDAAGSNFYFKQASGPRSGMPAAVPVLDNAKAFPEAA